MTEFGNYPALESRVYVLTVQAHAIPLSVHVLLPGSGSRDFVFIPDGSTAQLFPDAFAGFGRSEALGSIFRYIGVANDTVPLATTHWTPSPRPLELRFAIARWSRTSTVPLPAAIHSVQSLPSHPASPMLHEIVVSTSPTGEAR